ncbi:hypothetical protein V5799_030934 [Amblyomma americanum]|uniref:Monocarboxylate transporter n=1 Tax=Amblyomma americanum TaxID=6943 RepID=A0AAQ4EMR2_AMBAM
MEHICKKRKVLRTQVTKLIKECLERLDRLTQSDASVLHARLMSLHAELNAVNSRFEEILDDDQAETEYEQIFEYNDRIVTVLAKLQQCISNPTGNPPTTQHENNAAQATTTSKIRLKLPRLELTRFSGRRHDWQPFWEVFEQVVDKNEELSSVDKFHYLRASVTGDAAAALAGLPPTARCYSDAVELLKKRFGNEELLIQEHMKKLIDIQPVRSSDDVRGLRRLYDTLAAHIKGLETLGQRHDSYSSLLMPIVQRALPTDILLDYSRQCLIATTSSSDEDEESTTDDASESFNETKKAAPQPHEADSLLGKSESLSTRLTRNLRSLATVPYLHVAASRAVSLFVLSSVLLTAVDFGSDNGLDGYEAVALVTASAVGDLVSRICIGLILDSKVLSGEALMLGSFAIQAGSLAAMAVIKRYWVLMASCFFTGLTGGGRIFACTVMVAELFDERSLPLSLGVMNFIAGIACLARPPVVGYVRDALGSYDPLYVVFAAINAAFAVTWAVSLCYHRCRKPQEMKVNGSAGGNNQETRN